MKRETERKKQTHQETVFLFQSKCFLFFKFIYKWLLQHNASYAIYLLLIICIPRLSVLDQSRIQNSKMEHKMDLFAKFVHGYDLSTMFVKNSISDVPLSLNTTLQIANHY